MGNSTSRQSHHVEPPVHEVSWHVVGDGRIPASATSVADPRGIQSSRSRDVRKLSTTKSATSSPSRRPLVRSKRKCTPAKMRLSVASSAAAGKLLNERSFPGITSEVTLNSKWSLRKKEVN